MAAETAAAAALFAAANAGDVGGAAAALAAGATLTQAVTPSGSNALQVAAFSGHAAMCEFLLSRGAEGNAMRESDGGTTPLYLAAQNGHAGVVSLLLKHGAAADPTRHEYGDTPLIIAAQNGHSTTVRALLFGGADAAIVSDRGDDALKIAERKGHQEIVALLRNPPDEEGVPPVGLPATWTKEDVAEWVRGHPAGLPDGVAEKMQSEEVDGETLLAFASKHDVREGLGIPLGKAIKVWQAIEDLKTSGESSPAGGGAPSAPPPGMDLILVPPGSDTYMHADSLIQSSWAKCASHAPVLLPLSRRLLTSSTATGCAGPSSTSSFASSRCRRSRTQRCCSATSSTRLPCPRESSTETSNCCFTGAATRPSSPSQRLVS